jgi:hypothetical protein
MLMSYLSSAVQRTVAKIPEAIVSMI